MTLETGTATHDETLPEILVSLPPDGAEALFGTRDAHLKKIEQAFGVHVAARGAKVRIRGDNAVLAARLLDELGQAVSEGFKPAGADIDTAIRVLREDPEASLLEFFSEGSVPPASQKPRHLVKPRSINQKIYMKAMEENDLVFSIGPAGTGKTYLAVAMAAAALLEKRVQRLVLARPAVEAGERLGFLPGDLEEKINPYLRPLHDALYDILGMSRVGRMMERGVIEVAPLAFMRGRTLNDAYIILDEAQNTTPPQMKMFLTRVGFNSKAVVTGDVTQIDLASGQSSGLVQARQILANVPGIRFVEFGRQDVVRHPLVQQVVAAYESWEAEREGEPDIRRPNRSDS